MTSTTLDISPAASNKTHWIAIGVLGIAVVAMGGTLLTRQNQPVQPPAIMKLAADLPATLAPANPSASVTDQDLKNITKVPAAQLKHAQAATKYGAANSTGYRQIPLPSTEPAVARAPTRPLCDNCGTVQRVTPVERDGAASGVGVVAGGVLGAVVGNQLGGGNGKTLATVLGAVGGGLAGNTVEKKMNKVTQYEVTVRMEDGSTRTVQHATPVSVGAQVTVDGHTLRQ